MCIKAPHRALYLMWFQNKSELYDVFALFTTVDPSKKLITDVFVLFTTVDPSKKLPADVFVLLTCTQL